MPKVDLDPIDCRIVAELQDERRDMKREVESLRELLRNRK